MSTKTLSRRMKAAALVPVALMSGIWTASLVTTSATATSASSDTDALPDGTSVPSEAIEAPASVPVPGVIAPAVPEGSADSVVSGASSNGIPAPALAAYQRAAQIINSADKSCNVPWELIAAIGRVESDHGRYGGNTLTENGVVKPGIYGIALNGKNGTAAINDTDGGQLDKDTVYDRAVGPMQFIPSTWQVVKVDADGDDQRNPQDMDDASLATAVYLCSGSDNLSTRSGQEAAVYRYNHSQDYVNLVLRIMEAYSSGDYTAVPSGTYGGTTFSSSYSSAIDRTYKAVKERKAKQKAAKQRAAKQKAAQQGGGSSGSGGSGGSDGLPATGNGSNGGTDGVLPGGSGGGGGGDPVDGVKKKVGDVVGGLTGGGKAAAPRGRRRWRHRRWWWRRSRGRPCRQGVQEQPRHRDPLPLSNPLDRRNPRPPAGGSVVLSDVSQRWRSASSRRWKPSSRARAASASRSSARASTRVRIASSRTSSRARSASGVPVAASASRVASTSAISSTLKPSGLSRTMVCSRPTALREYSRNPPALRVSGRTSPSSS